MVVCQLRIDNGSGWKRRQSNPLFQNPFTPDADDIQSAAPAERINDSDYFEEIDVY